MTPPTLDQVVSAPLRVKPAHVVKLEAKEAAAKKGKGNGKEIGEAVTMRTLLMLLALAAWLYIQNWAVKWALRPVRSKPKPEKPRGFDVVYPPPRE